MREGAKAACSVTWKKWAGTALSVMVPKVRKGTSGLGDGLNGIPGSDGAPRHAQVGIGVSVCGNVFAAAGVALPPTVRHIEVP